MLASLRENLVTLRKDILEAGQKEPEKDTAYTLPEGHIKKFCEEFEISME